MKKEPAMGFAEMLVSLINGAAGSGRESSAETPDTPMLQVKSERAGGKMDSSKANTAKVPLEKSNI